jgi:hypothetical protein
VGHPGTVVKVERSCAIVGFSPVLPPPLSCRTHLPPAHYKVPTIPTSELVGLLNIQLVAVDFVREGAVLRPP